MQKEMKPAQIASEGPQAHCVEPNKQRVPARCDGASCLPEREHNGGQLTGCAFAGAGIAGCCFTSCGRRPRMGG